MCASQLKTLLPRTTVRALFDDVRLASALDAGKAIINAVREERRPVVRVLDDVEHVGVRD
eukprot:6138981-Pleurochrysis_carterae.AAC.1